MNTEDTPEQEACRRKLQIELEAGEANVRKAMAEALKIEAEARKLDAEQADLRARSTLSGWLKSSPQYLIASIVVMGALLGFFFEVYPKYNEPLERMQDKARAAEDRVNLAYEKVAEAQQKAAVAQEQAETSARQMLELQKGAVERQLQKQKGDLRASEATLSRLRGEISVAERQLENATTLATRAQKNSEALTNLSTHHFTITKVGGGYRALGSGLEFTALDLKDSVSSLNEIGVSELELAAVPIDSVEPLRKLTNLRKLTLSSTGVDDFAPIEDLRDLEEVTIISLRENINLNLDWVSSLKKLRTLNLNASNIKSLKPLLGVKGTLRSLGIGCRNLSPLLLEDLYPIPNIDHLELTFSGDEDTEVDMAGLRNLRSKEVLKFLGLSHFSPRGLESVAALTGLKQLWFDVIGRANFSALASATVEQLTIRETTLKDLGFIRQLPGLEIVDFKGSNLGDIAPLSALRKITAVDLSGTDVESVESLKGTKSIQLLRLARTKIVERPDGFQSSVLITFE